MTKYSERTSPWQRHIGGLPEQCVNTYNPELGKWEHGRCRFDNRNRATNSIGKNRNW